MSDLVGVGFDDEYKADDVLLTLRTSLSAKDEAELRQALEAKQEALSQAHA